MAAMTAKHGGLSPAGEGSVGLGGWDGQRVSYTHTRRPVKMAARQTSPKPIG